MSHSSWEKDVVDNLNVIYLFIVYTNIFPGEIFLLHRITKLFSFIQDTSTLSKSSYSPGSCFLLNIFFSPRSEHDLIKTWKVSCIFLWNNFDAKHNPNGSHKKCCLPNGTLTMLKNMLCFSSKTCHIPADLSSLGKHWSSAISPRNYSVVCGRKSCLP